MFTSAFYLIAFKSCELLYTLLYFFCSYVPFFQCLCSLLWTLGGTGRNESLFYIVDLYLSYYSSKSSLNQWSLLLAIITSHLKRSRIATISVEFRVTVFHCPQTAALSKGVLSYVILFYWVVSLVAVVRHRQLGLGYWATILYRLGFIVFSRFGGVYSVGTHDAFRAEDRKPVPTHAGWGHLYFLYMFGLWALSFG